jgi:hypothetical protein
MSDKITVLQSVHARIRNLRDNTIVIDNPEKLDFKNINTGVILIYPNWSGPGIDNCIKAVHFLYEKNYSGQIIILDNDCLTADLMIKLFGQVLHGWGEILVVNNGIVLEKYLNKESFDNFKKVYPHF